MDEVNEQLRNIAVSRGMDALAESKILVLDLSSNTDEVSKIITDKIREDASKPVLWYENSQLMGDSITIYLDEGQIENLVVSSNSFMLSQNKNFDKRFDQTSA